MFEVLTAENSQRITLNDNAGRAPTETWVTARGVKAIAWAVKAYAKRYRINPARVGYAVTIEEKA